MTRARKALSLVVLVLAMRCAESPTAGGGSNTGTIAGALVDSTGAPVAGLVAKLYRSDALPVLPGERDTNVIARDTCGPDGAYVFAGIDPAVYNVECVDSTARRAALVVGVEARAGDTVSAGSAPLRATDSVVGIITNPQTDTTVCFVFGSSRLSVSDDPGGLFALRGIPRGPYDIEFRDWRNSGPGRCRYTYTLGQLPDTTTVVRITLECD